MVALQWYLAVYPLETFKVVDNGVDRKEPKNFFNNFLTEPLEIKFFGVKGTTLEEDDTSLSS